MQGGLFQPVTSCSLANPASFSIPKTASTLRPIKRFEVAEVRDNADSPPLSDLSAQSSTENVARDVVYPSHPTKVEFADLSSHQQQQQPMAAPPPRKISTHAMMGGLESASDNSIGLAHRNYQSHSVTPEPTGMDMHGRHSYPHVQPYSGQVSYHPQMPGYAPYPHNWTIPAQHPSMSHVPILTQYPAQEHYNTTTYLPQLDHRYSSGIYTPSHHHSTSLSGSSSQSHPPQEGVPPNPTLAAPRGVGKLPSFSDVPQGELLAKAFMTFLHSISAVFRDPAFVPLMQSLDQHFEASPAYPPPHQHHGEDIPPSPPTTPNQEAGEKPRDERGLSTGSVETAMVSEGTSEEDVAKMIHR